MGAAPGSGWDEGEFEFKLVFEEEQQNQNQRPSPVCAAEEERSRPGEESESGPGPLETTSHDGRLRCISIPSPPASANQRAALSPSSNPRAGMHSPPPRRAVVREFSGTYESLPARSVQVSESRVVECPSIQITTISPEDESPSLSSCWDINSGGGGGWDRERLYLPLLDPFSYRERSPGSVSPSPVSSPSSRGWLSPASSCDSLSVEDEELNEATVNFGLSPQSRPTSPGGKRRRNSPLASPCTSRRGSYSEDTQGEGCNLEADSQTQGLILCELSVPQKTRKTSLEQLSPREVEQEQAPGHTSPCPLPEPLPRREAPPLGMDYLPVPPALVWGRTRANAHSPLFRSTALPPLDWPLPSQFDQFELKIEVQPRPHHRAHYETEGSRGAVKATPSGHPVVKLCGYSERKPLSLQVFVGTADDRSIRPHPFYQIHRVTGKMVGTASHESVQAGTKLLDIPLTPENNMTALIDCAGILKLRNSDIELRKGETDVGRKNTRVRLVFRTHLPLAPPVGPPGRVLALQVASLPIECSQRSAQELPAVESLSLSSSSAEGGDELLLSGNNFLPISRVVFMERGTDGKVQWEEEAHVDRDNSTECLLCVRVPAYSDLSMNRPVSVSLYVSNGKRKRSGTHSFKYLPIMFKESEPLLPRPSTLPLDSLHPPPIDHHQGALQLRPDPSNEDRSLGFHLPLYPYSPPCPSILYPDDSSSFSSSSKPEAVPVEDTRGLLSERQPSFENLELGFTELLPPFYPRGPQPPSPSPWLDSPYLSSSPSPSHSSSLSPFPAGSPISTSPLPPMPSSPYPQFHSVYPQEVCPSPPPLLSTSSGQYQDMCPVQYSQFDGWEVQGRHGGDKEGKALECPLEFSSSMQHITFEEVTELIGDDLHSYHSTNLDNQN
ncbi:nuclear factor of activated T-cells, cytoplasmic 4 [Periophthalmus magnuspinnatus]|uniref:nuclear factor of activated T-cells, cytoplasmic 4 n=1 Tax=Periophthalmus magnuspinnatus TaxID=409849 RepID=UPI002436CB4C|nr:nuclear factor of activated T-cells, cytoplasmic 4 [Periophthalmus magnuspinnatus]